MPEQWTFPGTTLERIVDGDTFLARVSRVHDFGFHIKQEVHAVQRFRLARAAAAPIKTTSGLAAASRLSELLAPQPFILTSLRPYKYGDEWMAEVVLSDTRNLVDVMIAEKLLAPWDGRGAQPLP